MVSAIIVAAGKGLRMGPNMDKLFLKLNGCPVVAHTWRIFDRAPFIDELIIVVREGMQSAFAELAEEYIFQKRFRFVTGGAQRQDSVWSGLQALSPDAEIVLIQDAARPCTTPELLAETIEGARMTGAAVAAQPVTDTVKESLDGELITRTLDRSRLWAVQTPQTFQVSIIRRALEKVRQDGVVITDDTAACELINQPVRLILGKHPNPKVTRPEDIPVIEALLSNTSSR